MGKPTICHPDRKHYAKGKCHRCYKREQYRPTPRVERKAECHPDRKHKGKGLCGPCIQKQNRVTNPELYKEQGRKSYARNIEAMRMRARRQKAMLKAELLTAYGGRCMCCGETAPEFLSIDHANGDGQEHRKRVGSGGVWGDLRRQGYPREGYRLLCMNCQFGTMRGKACPHQVAKEQIA